MDTVFKILVVDLDNASQSGFKSILQNIPGVKLIFESKELNRVYAAVQKDSPHIILLNLQPKVEDALKLSEKISINFPQVKIFATARNARSDLIIRAMRAGAREFIMQPINKEELVTAVKSEIRIKRYTQKAPQAHGVVYAFHGVKGGIGSTTTAANTAIALAQKTEKDVILIDLNLQMGNAALYFDIKSKYSILDVIKNLDDLDLALLKESLPKHDSGVRLLSPPLRIEEAEMITPCYIEDILALLRNIFDYILIDTHNYFDDITLKVLDESDKVLLISYLDVPTIFNTQKCLDLFTKLGYNKDKLLLLLNRYFLSTEIDSNAMEELIHYPIFYRLPLYESKNTIEAVNRGIPFYLLSPNSKYSQRIEQMISKLRIDLSQDKNKVHGKRFLQKILG